MTRHDDVVYVALMRDEVRGAMRAIEGRTRDGFIADEMAPAVAAYHFVRLAERPLKASAAFREAHPEIPWEDLAAIRSRTEPEFPREDPEVMWQIITDELPPILEALEALLPDEPIWLYRTKRDEGPDDDERAQGPDDGAWVSPGQLRVEIPMERFVEICNRYDVRRVRLFGSVLRDDFGPDSDIDMLVDFGPDAPRGWGTFDFDDEVSELLEHKADVMHGKVIRYIRKQVMAEAVTIYKAEAVAVPGEER